MKKFANNKRNVLALASDIEKEDLELIIFGGWSVELQQLKEPWQHSDIDLLLIGDDFKKLISFVNSKHWEICKSYSHKKAFLIEGVMVEVFLVVPSEEGYVTHFIGNNGTYDFIWPEDLITERTIGSTTYKLASEDSMTKYFQEHKAIQSHSPWK